MDPFTALMLAGTAVEIFGNVKANLDQARAEAENAIWMKQQADYIKRATDRELSIFDRESQESIAATENTFAKSGVSMAGTALEVMAQEQTKRQQELDAIVDQGNTNIQEALLKSSASQKTSDTLGSFSYNMLQTASSGLKAGERYASRQQPTSAQAAKPKPSTGKK